MNSTYNVDAGRFLLLSKNVPLACAALKEWMREEYADAYDPSKVEEYKDFVLIMAFLGIEAVMNDRGDCIDLILQTSSFGEALEFVLCDVIAPFVEDGSYLVFYGDSSTCWGPSWEKNDSGVVEGSIRSVECALDADLKLMLEVVKECKPEVFRAKKLAQKYGWLFPFLAWESLDV